MKVEYIYIDVMSHLFDCISKCTKRSFGKHFDLWTTFILFDKNYTCRQLCIVKHTYIIESIDCVRIIQFLAHIYTHTHTHTHAHTYICIYMCIYMCIYICAMPPSVLGTQTGRGPTLWVRAVLWVPLTIL